MPLAESVSHKIVVEGDQDPKNEKTVRCSCGWSSTVLSEFVVAVVERHSYLTGLTKP